MKTDQASGFRARRNSRTLVGGLQEAVIDLDLAIISCLRFFFLDSTLHAPIPDWPAYQPCCTRTACIGMHLINSKTQGVDVSWSTRDGSTACHTCAAETPTFPELSFVGLFLPFHIQIGHSVAGLCPEASKLLC